MADAASSPTIRPYDTADWSRLCEIHDAARMDELKLSVGADAFLSLEDSYENEGLFDGAVAVAELDGVVRGFVAFSPEELTWIYVEPAYYRRGIGRALLRHAAAAGAPDMQIDMLDGNAPALALYEGEGFFVAERRTGKLAGNEGFAAMGMILKRKA